MYRVGLSDHKEAVISEHFLHAINCNADRELYNRERFFNEQVFIDDNVVFDNLISTVLNKSHDFIKGRVVTIRERAKKKYKLYHLEDAKQVGINEIITEVMFDQQFIRGSKENVSRSDLCRQISKLLEDGKQIKMVIPALPYKSSSPLKARGIFPDLSEISFLLGLYEIVKIIDCLCHEAGLKSKIVWAKFIVICDGGRFNRFLNEPDYTIQSYQANLVKWIQELGINEFIEITDYQYVVNNVLPDYLKKQKATIRENICKEYMSIIMPLLNPYDMQKTIAMTIRLDPNPECSHAERRFIPLFKSLIYIVQYKVLSSYAKLYGDNYSSLYRELTKNIFIPYLMLNEEEVKIIADSINNSIINEQITRLEMMEYLRQSMLREAWEAAINYMAEIRSDRDLPIEPITVCFPDYIRWTIHAKAGQLAILTPSAIDSPVQPWHGSAVFKESKRNKIKMYALPALLLESQNAIPVVVRSNENRISNNRYGLFSQTQPLFYIDKKIGFHDMETFIEKLSTSYTRHRKS